MEDDKENLRKDLQAKNDQLREEKDLEIKQLNEEFDSKLDEKEKTNDGLRVEMKRKREDILVLESHVLELN